MADNTPNWNSLDTQKHLRDFEDRFDGAQGEIRRSGALWILAAFGALAFLVTQSPTTHTWSTEFEFGIVALLGSLGLIALWTIDQGVYQRLLHSTFLLGLYLEFSNPQLPPIRLSLYVGSRNISWKLAVFYFLPILFLLVIAVAALFTSFFTPADAMEPMSVKEQWVLGVLLTISVAGFLHMSYVTLCDRKFGGIRNQYPVEFTKLFDRIRPSSNDMTGFTTLLKTRLDSPTSKPEQPAQHP